MHIVTSFLVGLLCLSAGDVCTLSDQDSQEQMMKTTCGLRIPEGQDEAGELEKKAIEKLILAFGSFKLMAKDEKSWTAIPNDNASQEIQSVLLKCTEFKDRLPNACSGLVIIPVSSDGGNITTNITYGMGVYSVANFSQSLYVIEKEVLGLFALGKSGWCGARYQLSSGDCLGLNTNPLEVVPPPEAPPLEDPSLRLVAPFVTKAPNDWIYKSSTSSTTTTGFDGWGSDWADSHHTTQRTRVRTEPTTTMYVHTTPAPGGLGAGGVILIVLILLVVGLVLGGLAYFYMQRNRIEEQRALRTTQEIELHANVA